MNQSPGRWHRVAIEWSDGASITTGSIQMPYEASSELSSSVATSLGCLLGQIGLSEVLIAAEILSHSEPNDTNGEVLAQAAGRFLRRREESLKQ
ncbi:MAG: hypothetical protein JNM80_00655 [Phycisphaerae bacterium]|nr:hypothetical protein [Phycisphaerae bacterium]